MITAYRAKRKVRLTELLFIHGVACAVCCVAFPRFVGPIDIARASAEESFDASTVHDPSAIIREIPSPAGTRSYAEINLPRYGMPGSIDIEVFNQTSRPLYNILVSYDIGRHILVNPKALDRDSIVAGNRLFIRYPSIAAHSFENRAVDYRIVSDTALANR